MFPVRTSGACDGVVAEDDMLDVVDNVVEVRVLVDVKVGRGNDRERVSLITGGFGVGVGKGGGAPPGTQLP